MLLDAVGDIFGFRERGATWDSVRRHVTPDRVRELHLAHQYIWHANPESLAPPLSTELTALYLGDIDPEELAQRVFRFGLYTDEIYVIDPFRVPAYPGQDPIAKPDIYVSDTLRLIWFLHRVEPWIRASRLTLIPDPMSLDPRLWASALSGMQVRRELLGEPDAEDLEELRQTTTRQLVRQMTGLPERELGARVRGLDPSLSDEAVAEHVRLVMRMTREDPMAMRRQDPGREGQLLISRGGTSLESLQRICLQSGAFPYTYSSLKWRELALSADQLSDEAKVWSPLTVAFAGLDFEFLNNVDPLFASRMREEERLGAFRRFLKDIWAKAGAKPDLSNAEKAAQEFRERLGDEHRKAREEFDQIRRDAATWGITATGAFGSLAKPILAGGMDLRVGFVSLASSIVAGGLAALYKAKTGTGKLRVNHPLSVFVDLSRHRPRAPSGMKLSPRGAPHL